MTAPVPEPPLVVSVSGVAKVPLVEVTVRVAWSATPGETGPSLPLESV